MADPNIDNVYFLANWDGADGDTSYTPEIGPGVTFNGNAELDNAQEFFTGVTSCLFAAGNDSINFGDQAGLQFLHDETTDWTIEAWFRASAMPSSPNSSMIFTTFLSNSGVSLYFDSSGNLLFLLLNPNFNVQIFSLGAISINTDYYVKVTYDNWDGANRRVWMFLDGVEVASDLDVDAAGSPLNNNIAGYLGNGQSGFDDLVGWIGPVRISKELLYDTDVPTDVFPVPNNRYLQADNIITAYSVQAFGKSNYSAIANELSAQFVMEIGSDPPLRIPISSWQSTQQVGFAQYLQCVIPDAEEYIAAITAAVDTYNFTIYSSLGVDEYEATTVLASAPVQLVDYAETPYQYRITLSGYADVGVAPSNPVTYELTGIRSKNISAAGKVRARTSINYFLRPGDTADVDGSQYTADYINYYATNDGDSYMDVGER